MSATQSVPSVTLNLVSAVAAAPKSEKWDAPRIIGKPVMFCRDLEASLLARKASRDLPEQTAFDLRKARARALRGAISRADLDKATARHAAAEAFVADAANALLLIDRGQHCCPMRADGHGGNWTISDLISYWFTGESKSDAAVRAGY